MSRQGHYFSLVQNVEDLLDQRQAFAALHILAHYLDITQFSEVEVPLLLQTVEVDLHVQNLGEKRNGLDTLLHT